MHAALAAVAADATDPLSVITTSTTSLLPTLLGVGAAAIAVSGSVLGLRKGWGFFSKMIKA